MFLDNPRKRVEDEGIKKLIVKKDNVEQQDNSRGEDNNEHLTNYQVMS